jgi:spore maturation protein CgeB
LAAGALVLTNNVEGSEELFDGLLPTYTDRAELRAKLDRFLSDESERLELVDTLRRRVAKEYSYESRPQEFVHLAIRQIDRPLAAIKIAVPHEEVKPSWGDTHFAEALASALAGLGLPTEVHILPEWDAPAKQAVDIVIHLRGLTSYAPKPGHINVLWIISHPDDVPIRECEKYDLVLVASRRHAEWLAQRIQTPVIFMTKATDHRRFHQMEPDPALGTDVLFVGNSRGQNRPSVDWAIAAGLPLTVYGGGWERRIDARFVRGVHFPNEELARLYASAKVVLNDHWPDMRDHGLISNRIFDALAAGAVVVSDPVAGLEEMFGDLVPTYGSSDELEQLVRGLLEDDSRRKELVHEAAELVAERHTFMNRAEVLMTHLRPLVAGRKKDLDGGLFEL